MSRSAFILYAALWVCATVPASNAGALDWTGPYEDTFNAVAAHRAESDSYAHSLFWSRDMTPLPQPYLYYNTDVGRGLVFVDYDGKPAELCYAFILPPGRTQRVVTALIEIEVSFPQNMYIPAFISPGTLSCQTSPDGVTWSDSVPLSAGFPELPPVPCPEGTCYVRLSGMRAMINSLRVTPQVEPATVYVQPSDNLQSVISSTWVQDGAIIEVAPGTYSGPIDFQGKSITVRSAGGPQKTFINCTGGNRGIYLHGGSPMLAGFTIQGGRLPSDYPPSFPIAKTGGGGIYCESGSPTIANCIITHCQAGIGGGICVTQAQPTIINCVITDCNAVQGAGIALLTDASATIIDCTIQNNTLIGAGSGSRIGGGLYLLAAEATVNSCRISGAATGCQTGGGVYCSGSSLTLRNSLIVGNSANKASGLYAEQSSLVTLTNCTITQNRLTGSGTGGGVLSSGAGVTLSNCIVWGNGSTPISGSVIDVSYSDVDAPTSGPGNISQNPLFVSSTDLHLQSTSKCIDAGDPGDLAVTEPVPNGDRIDMGAYGGSPQASRGAAHAVYHVALNNSSDSYNGLSKDRAFRTIQTAVDRAQTGDIILIWPGNYNLSRSEEVNFKGKAVRIQSAADPAVISARDGYAFSFYNSEGSASILSNLVIQGCGAGAIFCHGASPTLKNLTIVGNFQGVNALENARPTIVNCIFWANKGANGKEADISQDSIGLCNPLYSLVDGKLLKYGTVWPVSDPLFADPANGDYHLKSEFGRYSPQKLGWVTDAHGVNSPCIDAGYSEGGSPEYADYRAETAPNGMMVDVGAHGGTPYASRSSRGY